MRESQVRQDIKETIKPFIPQAILKLRSDVIDYRQAKIAAFPLVLLKYSPNSRYPYPARKQLTQRMLKAHKDLRCAHSHAEIAAVVRAVLDVPSTIQGVVVEAGCFKGGSTAKLSIAAKMAARQLMVFDSFEGLPQGLPEESYLQAGEFAGTLSEVQANVEQYGEITACTFIKGWFHETLTEFHSPVVAAFVDVDLRDSVKVCLEHLYPLLIPGGSIFSHDGHIPVCVDLMASPTFWQTIDAPAPKIYGLGKQKLVQIQKPDNHGISIGHSA